MISTNKASIGRYEILGEIGRGAMGVVYKARDPHLDRIVAIKTISLFDLEPADEKEYRERFQQEARTAGRLSHPGIVAIYDVGSDPETNTPFIVMEYVAGSSLTKVLTDDRGKLPLAPALQIVQEVAEALDFAHSEGVTHRDVKPANILLTPDGRAKLADFGIARLDQSHLTLPGRLMGSPAYMAPEQMKGDAVDGRSDLFALGVVLYKLTTGYRPFQGNSTATVCYKLLRQDPLPPSALASELPPELDELLVKAMAKDPADRFQTGREMAHALQKLRRTSEQQEDPLEPLRRIIDRTGVSQPPIVPKEPLVFEVPMAGLEAMQIPLPPKNGAAAAAAPAKVKVDSTPATSVATSVASAAAIKSQPANAKTKSTAPPNKPSQAWMTTALVAAPVVAILGAILIFSAHHSQKQEPTPTANQEQPSQIAAPTPPAASEADTQKADEETPASAPAKKIVARREAASGGAVTTHANAVRLSKRAKHSATTTEDGEDASATTDQPIVVHNMEMAHLNVVIEHGFEEATASVIVDQKPLFSETLHGESKRRALLFRKTQGKQEGTINLLPGKHDIVVRVQSPADDYDASSTLSEGFSQGAKRVLLIRCDKRKNKLDAVIQ